MVKESSWRRLLLLPSDQTVFVLLSILVGIAAGITAYLYIRLVHLVQGWTDHASVDSSFWLLKHAGIVLLPALGGLIAGSLSEKFANKEKGTATANIIYRLRREEGNIPARITFSKALASAFTIGTGGSAGPEGPATQIGAGLGSIIGRFRHLSPEYRNTLVSAGAAAGIAAVFNAPIAGVMFALELLVRDFATEAFAMVVLATVTASVTSYLLLGQRVFLNVPTFELFHVWELGICAVLGVLAAFVSKFFVVAYLQVEKQFRHWTRVPFSVKAMLGGLSVGVMGLFLPQVMGDGHEVVTRLFGGGVNTWPLWLLFAIMVGKIFATSLSLGSGGSGGIFVPTLCFGAMLGGMVGRGAQIFFPGVGSPGAYTLLGMGAVFAGMTHAPFTAIMLLFELTGDYRIMLPLMLTVGVAILVSKAIYAHNIESAELLERGVRLHEKAEWHALENFIVRSVMAAPVETIPESLSLTKLTEFIARSSHTGFPVVDKDGKVTGLVTYQELHQAFRVGDLPVEGVIAKDIMRTDFPVVHPEDSLAEAVERMQKFHADRIIVTDPLNPGRVVGIITQGNIMNTYRRIVL